MTAAVAADGLQLLLLVLILLLFLPPTLSQSPPPTPTPRQGTDRGVQALASRAIAEKIYQDELEDLNNKSDR